MIIKRWTGSAWIEEFPKTKAQLVFNNGNTESIFDSSDKLKLNYLPNAVFDSLYIAGTISSNTDVKNLLDSAITNATSVGRSPIGYYYVATTTVTLTGDSVPTGVATTVINGKYYKSVIAISDEGTTFDGTSYPTTTTLEAGDWIVLTNVLGDGLGGTTAYRGYWSVVENSYELATTAIDGIVRLSSRTTYASLSGNNVVSEGTLKTVIDNASFALSSHTHGNILNGGTITSTVVAPADTDAILISDTSASGKVERGITIGTSTTTYLTNAGTWATPTGTYSHPAYTARSVDTDGVEVLDTFTSDATGHVTGIAKRTLPNATTSVAGVMSSTDKTKLDGIATGANAYVHPTYTYATPTADAQTTLANVQLISTLTQTNGHVTGGTARKLVAGTNVSITAASDGNITISSTDTNTQYTAATGGGLSLSSTAFQMVHPLYMQDNAPTSPLSGTIWFDL
jgi:hypothetical protein